MRIAVVGRGLIGSAAARHLALTGHDVVLIGPDEPADKSSHRGVFASHYDQGRITRSLDPEGFWADVSRASIERYAEIESASGVRFFTGCGALMAGARGSDWLARVGDVRESRRIASRQMRAAELRAAFPYLRLPDDSEAFYEPKGAGHVNPRRLVQAQGIAFTRAGGRIFPATVKSQRESKEGVVIRTDQGNVAVDRALIAAGGFTNALLDMAMPLTIYARTVALIEVGSSEAARLAGMPSMVLRLSGGRDPYLLPPIRYPDGKAYLKIGGDPVDTVVKDREVGDWFRSGGCAEAGSYLTELIREILPRLDIRSTRTDACVTVFSPTDRPVIERLSDRVAVATAGCGRGAKCSDELGRLGAEAVC
jgi:sarcosine oxidase